MIESNHVVLWNRCLDVIKDNVPETTYNTWFAPIVPLKYEDKTLILQIPSQFFYEILEERFVDLIRKTLYKVIGEGTKLMYNVMVDKTSIPNQTVNLEASNRSTAVTPKSIIGGNKAPSFLQAPAVQDLDPHLNPNYNFENFIEGYSNKLSRSVAEAVAQKPGGTAFMRNLRRTYQCGWKIYEQAVEPDRLYRVYLRLLAGSGVLHDFRNRNVYEFYGSSGNRP